MGKSVHCFPTLYGFTEHHPSLDKSALVMEYCSLGNLQTYLSKFNSSISWSERRSMLHEISIAISVAHELQLIHCDIHPGNILRADCGGIVRIKVSDFGLSRIIGKQAIMKNGTYGVIPYMAPELFKGKNYSKATDIYALGMIMWELATGIVPFNATGTVSFNECDDAILPLIICEGSRPQIPKGIPNCWIELMKKCWHADPSQRPGAHDIVDEVTTWSECCRSPWQPSDGTIESVLAPSTTTNLKAVEEFKAAELYRRENAQHAHKQSHLYSACTSKFIPLVPATPVPTGCIDNDEWENLVKCLVSC